MQIDGVEIKFIGVQDVTEAEARNYVEFIRAKSSGSVTEITVKACGDGMVDVSYVGRLVKFERIRRITGYLTGDLNSWNDSKQSEEHDRVKHS